MLPCMTPESVIDKTDSLPRTGWEMRINFRHAVTLYGTAEPCADNIPSPRYLSRDRINETSRVRSFKSKF